MAKLVFGYSGPLGMTPCIYEECGPYEGTIPEYNVRKVKEVETFDHLNPQGFEPDGGPIGCRWGGGLANLYEITPEQIEMLRAANSRRQAAYEQEEERLLAEAAEEAKGLKESGLCPYCGTWCHGDCRA